MENKNKFKLLPNKKYRIFYNEENLNNKIIHVRAIIDDQIVYKYWSKHRQRWIYEVKDIYFLNGLINKGVITKIK